MAEAPAIFGLILGFQGARLDTYIWFFVTSFIGLGIQPPTVLRPTERAMV